MVNKSRTRRGPTTAKPRPKRVKQQRAVQVSTRVVNTGSVVKPTLSSKSATVGTDRIASLTFPPNTPVGTVLYSRRVEVGMFPSLGKKASTFLRIRYSKLTFKLVSEAGSDVSGGIVMGFIPDAEAEIAAGQRGLDNLINHHGAKSVSAWKSMTSTYRGRESLFVSHGGEARLYCPGIFVVMTSGSVDKEAPLALYCDWAVALSVPGQVPEVITQEEPVVTCSFLATGQENLEVRNWNPEADSTDWPQVPQDLLGGLAGVEVSNLTVARFYRLPRPVTVYQQNDGTPYAVSINFIRLVYENNVLTGQLCFLPHKAHIMWDARKSGVLFQGDRLEPVSPYEFAGNKAGAFFINARRSTYAPGRSLVSKSISRMQSTRSGTTLEKPMTELETLFSKFGMQ